MHKSAELFAYALAPPCLGLTYRMVLPLGFSPPARNCVPSRAAKVPVYERAMRCPGVCMREVTSPICLRGRYAMPGTDLAYGCSGERIVGR
eukprot:3394739-Rhodomonas_salina.1